MHNPRAQSIKSFDEHVDAILHRVSQSPTLTMDAEKLYEVPVLDEDVYLLDHYMVEKGLIRIEKGRRAITSKGLEIANFGGWLAYQRRLKNTRPAALSESLLRYQLEIKLLKSDLERSQEELRVKNENVISSALIIKNLLEQNKNSRVMTFLGGMVVGIVVSIVLLLIIF